MRTLNISISDLEFSKFGLKKENISFSELLELVSNELTKKALQESVELAERYHLSDLTMDDISKEVKEVRKNAKGHS
jgi:predicted CopG family antitoxin